MKRRNNHLDDPVKSAIYNPKEFRGRHPSAVIPDSSGQPRSKFYYWFWLIIIVAFIVGALHLSKANTAASAKLTPASLPKTSIVQQLHQQSLGLTFAPLKLFGNKENKHCLFRLEDWQTSASVLTVFIRSGEVIETMLPLGQYRAKVACGSIWYGANLFGPDTVVNQFINPVVFSRNPAGNVTGMKIQLTQRIGGNLPAHQSNTLIPQDK